MSKSLPRVASEGPLQRRYEQRQWCAYSARNLLDIVIGGDVGSALRSSAVTNSLAISVERVNA
ncbi:hypothetical protein BQ8482_400051 [Mesorhizobium delmotii]|uniref:Uncharacterized protein n=1 Tax=Mesorhizobium delmotii TaxID=1631247 RepID=A0A2P9AT29_9HYPH|nr:hypothetical protein BQ8482_400051 [Mesorhizobium delmotii]